MVIHSRADAAQVGEALLHKWSAEMILITLGEDGMVLVSSAQKTKPVVEIDTVAKEVYDVSGAGDTVSAVFTLSLAAGATPEMSAELANHAAGIVVSEIGTAPVTKEKLLQRLESLQRAK